jgi:hypothetical protein
VPTKRCSSCGLIHPSNAARCDCGAVDFTVDEPVREPPRSEPVTTPAREQARFSDRGIYVSLILTLLYWAWESVAEGNIRVDLLLIYPVLFVSYVIGLWPRFRFGSVLIAVALMAINLAYAVASYRLFDKNPG